MKLVNKLKYLNSPRIVKESKSDSHNNGDNQNRSNLSQENGVVEE